ncbi:MAG: HNH endonuclease [Hyphomicrobiales bacterium]|nr:MAG: HNH endonuclease [Hyphomicrobiales bacterium]
MHNRGPRPTAKRCAACGQEFSLLDASHSSGRLRYSSKSFCDPCSPRKSLRRYVSEIARRDGWICSLCGYELNAETRWPDPRFASVDHVVPRSLGGPDDLTNYALACLSCNAAKQNRVP